MDVRWDEPIDIDGVEYDAVVYHARLLHDAELAIVEDWSSMDGEDIRIKRLTWQGHEFLDAARDQGRWAEVKKVLGGRFADATFGVILSVLQAATKSSLGLS